jgi:hypothetical protein
MQWSGMKWVGVELWDREPRQTERTIWEIALRSEAVWPLETMVCDQMGRIENDVEHLRGEFDSAEAGKSRSCKGS